MLCSRMSYLVLWNTCCKLSRSQILEVAVYKTFNLFAIAQVTFSVVCIMLSTFFPFVSFFEPFPSLLLLLITVISIPIFSSCNRLPSSLLPNIIHFFHRTLAERYGIHAYPRLLDGFRELLQHSNLIIARQSRIYHSLFHPNNVPVRLLKLRGKLVVITCWTCEDYVTHVIDFERWYNGLYRCMNYVSCSRCMRILPALSGVQFLSKLHLFSLSFHFYSFPYFLFISYFLFIVIFPSLFFHANKNIKQ